MVMKKLRKRIMTIEIADRLIQLRKKHGYSQEELADKLGLSRQAVSKWERAEASPDTDNLICLAKLYNVSLDELLSTDQDVDQIVEEQVKKDDKESKGDKITLEDDDGAKTVITPGKIECYNKDGKCVKTKKPFEETDKFIKVVDIIDCTLTGLMIILYVLLGVFLGMWSNGWVFFFIPDFLCSILRAIRKKDATKVNVVFLAIFTFFFVCMVVPGMSANLWHPLWTVFLIIPVYYIITGSINKILGKKDGDDEEKEPQE